MKRCRICDTPLQDFRFFIGGQVEVCEQWCPTCNCNEINALQEKSDSALIQFMIKLGVPSRYTDATLTTAMYDQSSLDFTKGTLWYGESGVGKTYQMVGMMKEAILNEYKVKFVDWSAVMCSLRCKPETYSSILDDMLNHGLIAIDDFYVDNNYTYDYVYHIIKALHGRDKRILMTATELPAQPKIAMRLAEMTNQYEVVNELEIIEATADLELRIVYDMINSTQFLEEFADKYKQGVLSNRYYSVMARLCIVFFNKFKTAPADKFERIFKSQIALGKIKPEVASEIQIVLSSFVNQEPITDVQVEIDSAYSYFQSQIIKLSAEEANALVESGKLDEAKQILNSVEEIKPVVVNSTDILQASDSEIDDLFRQEDERLISFEGELGRLMNNTLTRNSFVVFEGRGKVGKSHMLIYTARVARNQGNKTLFISCGDLTKNQVNKRILCGDAKTSTSPEYADKQFIPCLDCLKNQKGTCFERKGSGSLLDEWNDIPDKPVITSEEYIPCDDRACKEYKEAISYRQVHNPILTPEIAKLMRDSWCNQKHKGSLYVEQFPLGSLTYGGLVTLTKNICKKLGWEHPDVVVVDYIDAMATEGRDPREAVNQRWRSIRAYADIFKCLVVTATQSNATGFNTEDLTLASFSEDKRKIDNCSALYAINQTPEERIKNIWRIAALLKRESPYDERQQAKLYGCLACGTPHILSVHNFAELPKPTTR